MKRTTHLSPGATPGQQLDNSTSHSTKIAGTMHDPGGHTIGHSDSVGHLSQNIANPSIAGAVHA